jgi:hypothetical protein
MSDRNKPSIPAWQRAQPRPPTPQDDPVYSQPESNPIETGESKREDIATDATDPVVNADSESVESVPSDATSPTTAPPAETVESKAAALDTSDFAKYQRDTTPPPPPPPQQRPNAPPIITYPEFLIDAHKPPPLITPSRVINTLYAAGGISAILYGASKWLVTPMVDTLAGSRHDLLTHSQSKLEEFNLRLSNIVTKVPESKKDNPSLDADDTESVSSDPTELYHRDMGTQTSDFPSQSLAASELKKSPVDHATSVLEILQSHLAEMGDGSDKVGEAHKDRQLTFNKFRHYLDGMVYNMDGLPTWEAAVDGSMNRAAGTIKNDGIEELKKEIRGVKGVLLSAKRFPTARPMPPAST